MRKRVLGAGAAIGLAAAVTGGGVAVASGDDGEAHVTGPQAEAATPRPWTPPTEARPTRWSATVRTAPPGRSR